MEKGVSVNMDHPDGRYICEVILTHKIYWYAAVFEDPAFVGHRSERLIEQGLISLQVEGQG